MARAVLLLILMGCGPTTTGSGSATLAAGGDTDPVLALPTRWPLNDVWAVAPDAVFAVGMHGTVVRWTGQGWASMESETEADLWAVWANDPNCVFAAGANGTTLRFDGTRWHAMESGSEEMLTDVWGSGPSNVYAVGSAGSVLRFDGTSWRAVESTGQYLRAVAGSGPDDVWVAGDGDSLLRWDGQAWSPAGPPEQPALSGYSSLWVHGPDDAYALGTGLWHWDGTGWSLVAQRDGYGVWSSGQAGLVVVGSGSLAHREGSSWTDVRTGSSVPADSSESFVSVSGTGRDDIWAVGSASTEVTTDRGLHTNTQPTVAHWDGDRWRVRSVPAREAHR